jgi:ABC-type Fe3+/spermidine/putrescine transport system ATPase subunit
MEVYAHPATSFVADFIGHANFLDGTVEAVVSGETVRVRTLGSLLDASSGPGQPVPRVGDQVTLVLRPEALQVEPRDGAVDGGLSGEVRRAVYLGAVAEYEVALHGGNTVSVAQYGPATRRLYTVGQQVVVRVLEDAAHVLQAPARAGMTRSENN